MNQHLSRPIIRMVRLLLCVGIALSLLSGCTRPEEQEPKTVTVLDPAEILKFSFDGRLVTTTEDRSISPDGKHLLAAVLGETTDRMVAIPLSGDDAASAPDFISLYEVETSWTRHNLVQWFPLGWLSNSECVFAIHGWQGQGPHKGRRGTAIYTADIEAGSSSLISFVEVPTQGEVIEEAVLAEGGKIYVRISGQYLEFDLESNSHRLVRDDLPSYYGISVVATSPRGDQIVYGVYGEDKSGVYIFDVASGAERALVETGETLSFFPRWSPEGKYIAMYTLHRADDPSSGGIPRYNFIYGEDGPRPSAQEITIMDPQGTVLRTFSMGDQYLSFVYWLDGGESLVFISGPATFGKWGEVISAEYESVWIADVTGDKEPIMVADLSAIEEAIGEHIAYLFPVASLPGGTGALIDIGSASGNSIWQVSPGAPPSKIADGWWEIPRLTPVYIDSVAGIVISGSGENYLYLVGPEGATRLDDGGAVAKTIAAYNDEFLITSSYNFSEEKTEVTVYRMVAEKVVE